MVLSPDTANSAATAAVPNSPSPPSRRTSSGSARYTWKDSTYDPIIATESSRNDRLARMPRHWASTPALPSLPFRWSSSARRAGSARICTTLSSAKIPAATRQVTRKSTPVSTMPTSGPSRIPAW